MPGKLKKFWAALSLLLIISFLAGGCNFFWRGEPSLEYITLSLEITGEDKGEIHLMGEEWQQKLETLEPGEYEFEQDTRLNLRASPYQEDDFLKWKKNGLDYSSNKEISVLLDRNIKLEAVFRLEKTARITGSVAVRHNFPFSKVDDFEYLKPGGSEEDIMVSGAGSPAVKDKGSGRNSEIIAAYDSNLSQAEARMMLTEKGYEVLDINPGLSAALVKLEEENRAAALQALQAGKKIRYAEPNGFYYSQGSKIPDDALYPYQWHYPQIRLPQAWNLITGSEEVTIAVLDSGVLLEHPDLGAQIAKEAGYNFVAGNRDFTDLDGHGSHITGTIGADTDNRAGISGVMWQSRLVPVKVMEEDVGTWWDIAAGVYYAAGLSEEAGEEMDEEFDDLPDNPYPADIINMSVGGGSSSELLQEAIEKAAAEGILLVAAAGNYGQENLLYPAAYPEVIAVGAVDLNYPEEPKLAGYSNFSGELDVLAPGGDTNRDTNDNDWPDGVLSTYFTADSFSYKFIQGTSMAAAHVSGVLGLMLAQGVPADEARQVLRDTAMNLEGIGYDFGLVNAYWAVNQVDQITIVLLEKESGEYVEVKATEMPLKGGEFDFSNIYPGEYRVEAWIDVRGTGEVEPGDYFIRSELLEVKEDEEIEVDLILEEEEF